jgi:hypothetical protein
MQSKWKSSIVLLLIGALVFAFAAFHVLRTHQLSLPDPYHNPYTALSTGCLVAFLCILFTLTILSVCWRRHLSADVAGATQVIASFGIVIALLLGGAVVYAVQPLGVGLWIFLALAFMLILLYATRRLDGARMKASKR